MTTLDLTLDPNTLTIGDLEDFEEVVGKPIHEAMRAVPVKDDDGVKVLDDKGRPVTEVRLSSKALKALVWISQRRVNPDFTLEDARNVNVGALNIGGADPDVTPGNDESARPA